MSSVATIIAGKKRIAIPALETCPVVKEGAVSPQALALYRLLVTLSRRAGYACVKLLETLAQYHKAALSTTRGHLAELIAAGWIGRKQTRTGGVSKLFFWPLVRVAKRSRGLFAPGQAAFFAPNSGGYSGGYSPSNLAVTPSSPYKKAPVGKRDDSTGAQASTESPALAGEDPNLRDAVSLLQKEAQISLPEAQSILRDSQVQTATKGLSKSTIKHILTCFQAAKARGSVQKPGAWLRAALRSPESYSAPVEAPTHHSEVSAAPVAKVVKVRFDAPQSKPEAAQSKPEAFQSGEAARAALREKFRLNRKANS